MTMPASVPAMTAAPVAEAERYRRPPPAGPAIPRVRGIVRRIVRRVVGGRDVHGCRRDKRGFTRRCGRDVLGVGAVREAVILSGDFVLGSDSRNGGIVSVWIVTGADVVAAGQRKQREGATGARRCRKGLHEMLLFRRDATMQCGAHLRAYFSAGTEGTERVWSDAGLATTHLAPEKEAEFWAALARYERTPGGARDGRRAAVRKRVDRDQ